MARFSSFITTHISFLIVVLPTLAFHVGSISSSSLSPLLAPSPYDPEVEYLPTEYRPSSYESPSPVETEYDSLYPPLGLSRSFESPLLEIDEYGEATISPTTASNSPETPLASSLPSTPVEAPNSLIPSTSPPSLSSTDKNVEFSPALHPEDEEGSEANLWPDQQITSSMPYESSSSYSSEDDLVVYEQKTEKQPDEEIEDSTEEVGGKSGLRIGMAMGFCVVGLGGLVYMKRRKRKEVERTRSFMELAERRSLI